MYVKGMRVIGVGLSSIITSLLIPATAVVFARIVLKEPLTVINGWISLQALYRDKYRRKGEDRGDSIIPGPGNPKGPPYPAPVRPCKVGHKRTGHLIFARINTVSFPE